MELKEKIGIYRLCIDMAGKTSERRLETNVLIIVINTGLISLNSYLSTAGLLRVAWSSIICLVYIIVNPYRMFLVSAHRKINEAKYKTINKIENDNNFPFKPLNEEYDYLKSKRYFHLTPIECLTPLTLIILNIIIVLLTFNSETEPIPQTTIIDIISERT